MRERVHGSKAKYWANKLAVSETESGLSTGQLMLINHDLKPVEKARRVWGPFNFVAFWISDYGVQSWLGGRCVYVMIRAIWKSWDRERIPSSAFTDTTTADFVSFFLFWLFSLPLIVNDPDFTRFAKKPNDALWSQLFTIPIGFALTSFIGIMVSSASAVIYNDAPIWDPLIVLERFIDDGNSGERFGVFVLGLSFALAQLGTNIAANSISAGTDMTALLPRYINIRRGSYVCAAIGLAMCPWTLLSSSNQFTTYLSAYSVFLSSIAGVMCADYYAVRKGYLIIEELFSARKGSAYYFTYGIHWRAYAAYISGILINVVGFAGQVGASVPIGATYVYRINFFSGFIVSFTMYWTLCHFFPIPATSKTWMEVGGDDLDEDREQIPSPAFDETTTADFVSFFLFWPFCLPFLYLPVHKLRHLFTVKSYVVPVAGIVLMAWTVSKAGGLGPIVRQPATIHGSELSWALVQEIMSSIANFATLVVNGFDFSRFAIKPRDTLWSQLLAIPIGFACTSLIGIYVSSASAVIYNQSPIWDPLDVLEKFIDDGNSAERFGVFVLGLSFALAQVGIPFQPLIEYDGTNIAANSISAGTDMTALAPRWINIRRGSYVCACIALAMCPPKLLSSSNQFTTYLSAYSVFLSSIAGVMCSEYYAVRKGYLIIEDLFSARKGSIYYYNYGVYWRASVAMYWTLCHFFPVPGTSEKWLDVGFDLDEVRAAYDAESYTETMDVGRLDEAGGIGGQGKAEKE
ncbi:hypothetical protein ACHAQA_007092 [Verticillium albo-atrum]